MKYQLVISMNHLHAKLELTPPLIITFMRKEIQKILGAQVRLQVFSCTINIQRSRTHLGLQPSQYIRYKILLVVLLMNLIHTAFLELL